nr:hypothetical protein Iba_chr04dCG0540 [Ipomoea batatas]
MALFTHSNSQSPVIWEDFADIGIESSPSVLIRLIIEGSILGVLCRFYNAFPLLQSKSPKHERLTSDTSAIDIFDENQEAPRQKFEVLELEQQIGLSVLEVMYSSVVLTLENFVL